MYFDDDVELCDNCDKELEDDEEKFFDPDGIPLCRNCWEDLVGYD